jgi:hypothetical protein
VKRRSLSPLFTWRGALADAEISANDDHVALRLSCYRSERGDSAFPSLERLARDCKLSKTTIVSAIAELEREGWLTKTPGGGRGHPNYYEARTPETVHDTDRLTVAETAAQSPAATSGETLRAVPGTVPPTSPQKTETVRELNRSRRGKQSSSDEETVHSGRVNSPAAIPEERQDHVITTTAAAELANALKADAAAGLEHELEQLQAGATLKQLARAEPDRALAWIQTAKLEADRNAAGFVRAGLESGEWPSRRGDTFRTASATQSWIENTSWRLDPEHAHEILDERASTVAIDSADLAELHQLVDQMRDARREVA